MTADFAMAQMRPKGKSDRLRAEIGMQPIVIISVRVVSSLTAVTKMVLHKLGRRKNFRKISQACPRRLRRRRI